MKPRVLSLTKNLVTIHPIMCYYKQKVEDTEYLFKHSITCIGNDLKHDSKLVKIFEDKSLEIIKYQQKLDIMYQWTDALYNISVRQLLITSAINKLI